MTSRERDRVPRYEPSSSAVKVFLQQKVLVWRTDALDKTFLQAGSIQGLANRVPGHHSCCIFLWIKFYLTQTCPLFNVLFTVLVYLHITQRLWQRLCALRNLMALYRGSLGTEVCHLVQYVCIKHHWRDTYVAIFLCLLLQTPALPLLCHWRWYIGLSTVLLVSCTWF